MTPDEYLGQAVFRVRDYGPEPERELARWVLERWREPREAGS